MWFSHIHCKRNKKLLLGPDGIPIIRTNGSAQKLVLTSMESMFTYQRQHKTILNYMQIIF